MLSELNETIEREGLRLALIVRLIICDVRAASHRSGCSSSPSSLLVAAGLDSMSFPEAQKQKVRPDSARANETAS